MKTRFVYAPYFGFACAAFVLCALGRISPAAAQPPPMASPSDGTPAMPPSTAARRPDLFAPYPFYPHQNNFYFVGATDIRYRTLTTDRSSKNPNPQTIGSYIAATRLTFDYVRANPQTGDERGGVRTQILLENNNEGTALNRIRPSELYAYYRFLFPGVSANVRAGQFVLPFGLLAVYDTPLQPIQTLYQSALGLRVDTGVMLEGDYAEYHYAGSVTTGAGPDRFDVDSTPTYTFRLARAFPTRLGKLQIGGSLLSGRLPRTTFSTVLPPSGYSLVPSSDFVGKTRFAGDGQYEYRGLTARGEIIFGGDDQNPVYGHFIEADYKWTPRFSVTGFSRRWDFAQKPQSTSTLGAGINYNMGRDIVLRSLYEFERNTLDKSGTPPLISRRISLQTRLNF